MSIPFTELLKISNKKSVMTYYGHAEGCDFFAYLICTPDKAKQMHYDYQNATSRPFTAYGKMLYKDFLSEPDEKARDFLKKYLAGIG